MTRKRQVFELISIFFMFGFGVIGARVVFEFVVNNLSGNACNCGSATSGIIISSFLGSIIYTAFVWYYKRRKSLRAPLTQ